MLQKIPDDFAYGFTPMQKVFKKQIYFEQSCDSMHNNAILDELETFADAINNNTTPIVTLSRWRPKRYGLQCNDYRSILVFPRKRHFIVN